MKCFFFSRDWNSKHYIEPPSGPDEKERELQVHEDDVIDDDRRNREASGLVRTGRLFGGLIDDIKRKSPHYVSDFKDGLHSQCISSFLFLYFACLGNTQQNLKKSTAIGYKDVTSKRPHFY